jgi:2-oxoglutarate dehydrogenase dihydrolipoamide succinyltransferase (E2 component)
MPTQVLMPQLGESVVEGTLTRWLKAVGERVEQYEPLVEVNTDKVDTEVPSPASGVLLEVLVAEGVTVHAGTVLAVIGAEGEQPAGLTPAVVGAAGEEPSALAAQEPTAAPAQGQQPAQATAQAAAQAARPAEPRQAVAFGRHQELGFISPVVAKLAQEHGLDLRQITGTGQGGRITKQDVLGYIQAHPATPTLAPAPTPAPTPIPAGTPLPAAMPGDELLPLTTVRRRIAEHMLLSKHTSPHVTTIMEADLSLVVAHRGQNKAAFAKDGVNLTFTAYFVAAAVAALKAYPLVNSSWSEQGILLHKQINIGMATALEDEGLIVPVIHQADALSLLGLARSINDLAGRARSRKLAPDEVRSGTFTITNHGISGSLFATPIINQPQCGILGVGAIQKRVVVVESEAGDSLAIRPMVYLGLTFDHRILDGAVADNFLAKVVEYLEKYA